MVVEKNEIMLILKLFPNLQIISCDGDERALVAHLVAVIRRWEHLNFFSINRTLNLQPKEVFPKNTWNFETPQK